MKRPAFQFYGGDWLRDPGLRACSLAAKGLWIEMIAIMSQVENPYGHLVFVASKDAAEDGRKDILTPVLPEVLARIVGASEEDVIRNLAELEAFGVFSRTPEGIIYSRRMVRDEKVRESRAAGGFKSLENPNVPRRKRSGEDTQSESGRISSPASLEGSPASSTASSIASSELPKKSCAATSPAPALHEGKPITLQTNTGEEWTVAAADCLGWNEAYPGVNVLTELLKAREWLKANPRNRKTAGGMRKFIIGWLSRAQNTSRPAERTGNAIDQGNKAGAVGRVERTLNHWDASLAERSRAGALREPVPADASLLSASRIRP